ncbi:FecR family protein [Dyadobacter fanqingshengii]|uniref:FecR domain-containing protein n=1 Tax=Dyadobacter fanqingshengii TaxID=2906443 RepID=A0A9X1P466_9BACT|nr:FecR family protein [Dyadobacter fanqingshengii]MCF0038506.1 FecR domain-containing protein [Dyadobacter fanqingshengii]USJ34660.1 FecR domain-containing protein [Dyadobacter fanqingshengii]
MQDYARYDIKDFLADEAFCRWVLHQKPADNAFWENWVRNNPDRASIVTTAKELISEIHHAQNYLSEDELQRELQRLSAARKSATEELEYAEPSNTWISRFSLALGVLTCLIVLFYFYTNSPLKTVKSQISQESLNDKENEKWIEVTNDQSNTKHIALPDGSSVRLSPESKLSYPAKFVQHEREVLLNGEAFFDVTKNPESPFKVYTSDVVTTVLGTSFTVKAFDHDKDVRVVVKTGRVTVSANAPQTKTQEPEKNELVLLPNQQVVYHRDDQKMKRSLIENPAQVGPTDITNQNLVFDNAPVAKVFESLQKRYEVQIIYDADLMAGCQLTAELGQEPLFEKLGMICKAIQARYELIDGQIVIHGSSCK